MHLSFFFFFFLFYTFPIHTQHFNVFRSILPGHSCQRDTLNTFARGVSDINLTECWGCTCPIQFRSAGAALELTLFHEYDHLRGLR